MRTKVALATRTFAAASACGGSPVPAPAPSRTEGGEPAARLSAGSPVAIAAALLAAALSLATLSLMNLPQADATEITDKSLGGGAAPAHPRSDPGGHCLSRQEQRARIAARTVVPLAKAARAVKGRRDTLLNARLCERDGKLVYPADSVGEGWQSAARGC